MVEYEVRLLSFFEAKKSSRLLVESISDYWSGNECQKKHVEMELSNWLEFNLVTISQNQIVLSFGKKWLFGLWNKWIESYGLIGIKSQSI